MSEQIVIVGGNAAGMTAASRAKRLNPNLNIRVFEASRFVSYSICGLPYYIAQMVGRHSDLVQFTPLSLKEKRGIQALTEARVLDVLPGRHQLRYLDLKKGSESIVHYDRLVISTGYKPLQPRFLPTHRVRGLFTMSQLEDGIRLDDLISSSRKIFLVGGGYIGLMMAEALVSRGLEVTVLELQNQILGQLDKDMAKIVEEELEANGVNVLLESKVSGIIEEKGCLRAIKVGRETIPCDLALIDIGVEPNVDLAQQAGIPLGISGSIKVDRRGQTEQPAIYAAGNCAESINMVTGKVVSPALGTSAVKQGRVVGENLAGRRSEFPGTLETSVEKVFGVGVARTGLTLQQALSNGFKADSVYIKARNKASYFPDSQPLHVKLIFDHSRMRLLGGQMIGNGFSAKRIDTLVTALSGRMNLRDLSNLDLAYAPPFGTLWDPVQIAANLALRKIESGW